MKGLAKTTKFLIFWVHIMQEGYIYLCNLLEECVNQSLQQRTPKNYNFLKEYGAQG